MNIIRIIIATVALLLLPSLAPVAAQTVSPNEFILEAVEALGQKMDGRRSELADDPEALYALIDEVLLPRFERRVAAQQVLAKHWRTASD